jgi:hypothetical protein
MQQYHLRPVSELSRSPSSRSSRSPPDHDMSPPSSHLPPIQHSVNGAQAPPRRPLSPSSLPRKSSSSSFVDSFFTGRADLDVSNGQAMPPRIYPPPPTGHELMRLFPPNRQSNRSSLSKDLLPCTSVARNISFLPKPAKRSFAFA